MSDNKEGKCWSCKECYLSPDLHAICEVTEDNINTDTFEPNGYCPMDIKIDERSFFSTKNCSDNCKFKKYFVNIRQFICSAYPDEYPEGCPKLNEDFDEDKYIQ